MNFRTETIVFFPRFIGGKEDKHKVGIKLGKQPKVEEESNVDEKSAD
jgi:hypothetical protein